MYWPVASDMIRFKDIFYFYTPFKFVCGGYTVFKVSVRSCVRLSGTFCFLNILKSLCWIFIKLCKHILTCKTNTLNKKNKGWGPILELLSFVVINGFLDMVLCLCYYSPYTGQSTPTTAFERTI